MKNIQIVILISLLIGGALGYVAHSSDFGQEAGEHMHNDRDVTMGSTMDSMMAELSGKTGDEFDKAFLMGMIAHHEGAVGMAQEVLKISTRPELKAMADGIISAQTKEIVQMKEWQKTWFGK
jgi:uncharacterized protein (DUF305 family)